MRFLIVISTTLLLGCSERKVEPTQAAADIPPTEVTPYIWDLEDRPYTIELGGKDGLDVQHRYAVVHWTDMRYDIDKEAIWKATEEIWNEFSRNIEETDPVAKYKRISIRFPFYDLDEGYQAGNILSVAIKGASLVIPDWPPEEVDWVNGWDWKYRWIYNWDAEKGEHLKRSGIDAALFEKSSVFGEQPASLQK